MLKPEQIRMARAGLKWSLTDAAKKSGVSGNTINRIENGAGSRTDSIVSLQTAFEKAGIVFGADGSVRLLERRQRK